LDYCDSACSCTPNVGLSCSPDNECICPLGTQSFWSEYFK